MASAIVSVSSSVSSRSVHPFVIFMLTTCAPTPLHIRDTTTSASTCSFINRCSNGLWPIPFWRTSVASSSCDLNMQHGYASSAAAIIHELSMNSSGSYNEFLLLHDCPLHTTNCSPEPTIWLVVADAALESCGLSFLVSLTLRLLPLPTPLPLFLVECEPTAPKKRDDQSLIFFLHTYNILESQCYYTVAITAAVDRIELLCFYLTSLSSVCLPFSWDFTIKANIMVVL